MRRLLTSVIAGVSFTAGLTCRTAPPARDLNALLSNSPFAPAGPARGAPEPGAALEFRGVFMDQGELFFSLYETARHAALWVGLNEPGNPFTVRSYDTIRETVTVEYQGSTLALGLKQAVIQSAGPAANRVATGGGPGNVVPLPGGAVQAHVAGAPSSADEASKLARISEEIRRRRALRQQAVQSATPGATKPDTK